MKASPFFPWYINYLFFLPLPKPGIRVGFFCIVSREMAYIKEYLLEQNMGQEIGGFSKKENVFKSVWWRVFTFITLLSGIVRDSLV
jgi:hypothetical protein